MPPSAPQDAFPLTPGKVKIERSNYFSRTSYRWQYFNLANPLLWIVGIVSAATVLVLLSVSLEGNKAVHSSTFWGRSDWERRVKDSCHPLKKNGKVVLVTGAAGFVGMHVSLALKKRGDGVVGLDNFNSYYNPSLKRDRCKHIDSHGIFVVEGDINDAALLNKLFDMVAFTHIMHLAAQAGVRYAVENPASYVNSNIAGLVTLLEVCKSARPQPAIMWASSSSVYGLNTKVPFSEHDRTDRPASLYAATKKAGEEITHAYNHIYGLSITGLRFFTVYGPWGRPDMAYFSFTRDILSGKAITVYQGPRQADLARDFTFIDDIVKGCLGALDTAKRSTGTGGKKKGGAQFRIFNLGNTSPVTVPKLVNILEKLLKVKAKINVVAMPGNGDVPFTHANITLAQTEFHYRPTTDLQSGLKKFVKWYLTYYGESVNDMKLIS